jgi:thymidylate synthase
VAFAIVETIAILRGRRDAEFLTYWNRDLPRYVGNSSEMHGAYGYRLRFQFGVDQLEHAFLALQANSTSRQVVLSIWDPKADLPDSSGKPRAQDIPCNVCSMLKIRDGKLEWLQVMRSNDVFRGLPYNFVQFTTLQEVMAGWLGLELGAYVHVSDSLHVYESDLTAALGYKTPSETTRNRDSLALPKKESDAVWSRMASEVEELIHTSLSPERLVALATAREYPTAYANLMRVVVAEAYRRRGDDSSI